MFSNSESSLTRDSSVDKELLEEFDVANALDVDQNDVVIGNQNNNLGDMNDGLFKTIKIFKGRHVETEQEQKMVAQSSNDLNQIMDQHILKEPLEESIFIQTEQFMKVDAERQQAEARVKEDIESIVSANGKTITDLKADVDGAITKTGIILKQDQNRDNSALIGCPTHGVPHALLSPTFVIAFACAASMPDFVMATSKGHGTLTEGSSWSDLLAIFIFMLPAIPVTMVLL